MSWRPRPSRRPWSPSPCPWGRLMLPNKKRWRKEEEEKEDEKKEQEVKAWLAIHRLSHAYEVFREMGVESLKDLALDAEDEDVGQLALRSTFGVCRFRRALRDLLASMSSALRISTKQGGYTVKPTLSPKFPLTSRPHHRGDPIEQGNRSQQDLTSPKEYKWKQSN